MKHLKNLIKQFKELGIAESVNYDRFNAYSVTAHSTQIEGSTLTFNETAVLLEDGLTPKGKPLVHSLMVKDHYESLLLVKKMALEQEPITELLIQKINASVMKSTGEVHRTLLGDVDVSKGEYRKGAVFAGQRYFPSYQKVPSKVQKLVASINDSLKLTLSIEEQIQLSFFAHFEFVSIHPFYDGNGRTARLLMNLLQEKFNLPFSIVYKEDKVDYIESLEATRENEDITIFYDFMIEQYSKFLKQEVDLFLEQNT